MGLLTALHYPVGKGLFNPVPHDTSSRVVGTAAYDLTERHFTILVFSPPDSCGMRMSACDEVVYDDSAKTRPGLFVQLHNSFGCVASSSGAA